MANFSKATKGSAGNLLDHYERKDEIKKII